MVAVIVIAAVGSGTATYYIMDGGQDANILSDYDQPADSPATDKGLVASAGTPRQEAVRATRPRKTTAGNDIDTNGMLSVPEAYPSAVPVYPSNVDTQERAGLGSEKTYTLTVVTSDSARQIHAFFARTLTKNGWRITAPASGSRDNAQRFTITAVNDAKQLRFTATVHPNTRTPADDMLVEARVKATQSK